MIWNQGLASHVEKKSDEILIGDGRCIDCIELEIFYNITMQNL